MLKVSEYGDRQVLVTVGQPVMQRQRELVAVVMGQQYFQRPPLPRHPDQVLWASNGVYPAHAEGVDWDWNASSGNMSIGVGPGAGPWLVLEPAGEHRSYDLKPDPSRLNSWPGENEVDEAMPALGQQVMVQNEGADSEWVQVTITQEILNEIWAGLNPFTWGWWDAEHLKAIPWQDGQPPDDTGEVLLATLANGNVVALQNESIARPEAIKPGETWNCYRQGYEAPSCEIVKWARFEDNDDGATLPEHLDSLWRSMYSLWREGND